MLMVECYCGHVVPYQQWVPGEECRDCRDATYTLLDEELSNPQLPSGLTDNQPSANEP